jgi:hypothetical protein
LKKAIVGLERQLEEVRSGELRAARYGPPVWAVAAEWHASGLLELEEGWRVPDG